MTAASNCCSLYFHLFLFFIFRPFPVFFHRLFQWAKQYSLALSILCGVVLYRPLSFFQFAVPYLIVLMLFFTFLKLEPGQVRFRSVHLLLLLIQVVLSILSFWLVWVLPLSNASILAQGIMICFLCPVASASPVIVQILGGNTGVATSYVLIGSLCTSLLAPSLLGWMGDNSGLFWLSFWQILKGIAPLVLSPLLLAKGVQLWLPRVRKTLGRIPSAAFWVWVVTLSLIMAKTVSYMVSEPREMVGTMIALALLGLVACAVQFALGKWLGNKLLGEPITLGQALAQKNSTIGIWLVHTYLNPLASVGMASYSIWQNLFNTFQLMQHRKYVSRNGSCPS